MWGIQFDTYGEAYAACELVVDEEGMQAFTDQNNVIPFPSARP